MVTAVLPGTPGTPTRPDSVGASGRSDRRAVCQTTPAAACAAAATVGPWQPAWRTVPQVPPSPRSTSAAPSSRWRSSCPTARCSWRARAPTHGVGADGLFAALGDLLEDTISASSIRPEAIGVGCGGPMSARRRSGVAAEHPAVARLPAARPLGAALRAADLRRQRRQGTRTGGGLARRGAGASDDYLAMVVSTGCRRRASCWTVGCSTARHGNAGHLGHVIVEPLGRVCACGARGCLEAEVSGTAIAAVTGAPAQDAPHAVRVRTGRLVGRAVASVANLLDLRLAVVAGSVALGFGATFFDAANEELERCARLDFSAWRPDRALGMRPSRSAARCRGGGARRDGRGRVTDPVDGTVGGDAEPSDAPRPMNQGRVDTPSRRRSRRGSLVSAWWWRWCVARTCGPPRCASRCGSLRRDGGAGRRTSRCPRRTTSGSAW